MFDLTGKCALITGASGDIGAAIACHLHARGRLSPCREHGAMSWTACAISWANGLS